MARSWTAAIGWATRSHGRVGPLVRCGAGSLAVANGALFVSATSLTETALVEVQITNLLRERHHLAEGAEDDFQVRNAAAMGAAQAENARTMSELLASIAAIALLVAGIGVMNIMLVSVTERTREIGLRLAVGARPRDILGRFLSVSVGAKPEQEQTRELDGAPLHHDLAADRRHGRTGEALEGAGVVHALERRAIGVVGAGNAALLRHGRGARPVVGDPE